MSKQTITIAGIMYDAETGLRVGAAPVETSRTEKKANPAKAMHARVQRSQTLNRATTQKPPAHVISTYRSVKRPQTVVTQSPAISKFANSGTPRHMINDFKRAAPAVQPQAVQKPAHLKTAQTPQPAAPVATPAAAPTKAKAPAPAPQPTHTSPSAVLQNTVEPKKSTRNKAKKRSPAWRSRLMAFSTGGFALLLLAGYFTYINIPNLSVRVAAVQSGVDASYPDYRPKGYQMHGPVAYEPGQVSMQFKDDKGESYTIKQTKSDWDSQALLANYVQKQAGDNYMTTTSRGLTMYSFDGQVAWVNNGILYTISGDAFLSSDDINRLSASL